MLRALLIPIVCICATAYCIAQPRINQVLHRGNGAEVQTLDPHLAEGVPAANILDDLYEGLVTLGKGNRIAPGVAKSWEIMDNGTRYLFRLRRNARWSKGDPLTAEDFVYGFRRVINPATRSTGAQFLSPIAGADAIMHDGAAPESLGVTALEPYLLEIRLKAPTPYFMTLLKERFSFPVHRKTIETYGNQFSRSGRLVSNGAYMLKDWVVQSHVRLKKNAHYWNADQAAIEEVVYYPVEDQSSELKRYRAGELDYTYEIPNSQFNWVQDNLGDELKIHPYAGIYYFGYNLTKPPFKDNLKLRKALSLAINREVITRKITGMGERPAYSWVPDVFSGYSSQSLKHKEKSQQARNAIARELYQEAGYSRDRPLEVEIRYNTSENHKKITIAVAAMWKQVLGVKTRLLNEEWKVFLNNRSQKQVTQVFRAGFIGYYPFAYLELMHSNHQMNDTGYANPEYDTLIERAAVESDAAQRTRLMQQAEQMILNDQVLIPLYVYVSKHLVKPYVEGYESNPEDRLYTKDLYIRKE